MRVYLAATLPLLRAAMIGAAVGPAPMVGFAVSPTLREWYAEGDQEELEYVALTEAARASLRLLDADEAAPRRRVVLAAELPEVALTPRPDLDRAAVSMAEPVPLAWVAAVHVDEPAAEAAVATAAAAVVEADLGSEDAQFRVDGAEGHELLWYAAQEMAALFEPG